MSNTSDEVGHTAVSNPYAYDNGVMARRYGLGRNTCHKPLAEKRAWQRGWDAEDSRRAALSQAKGGK